LNIGDVGLWVCDSEECSVFVVMWKAICLRKDWYEFNIVVGAAGDEDGFDFVAFEC